VGVLFIVGLSTSEQCALNKNPLKFHVEGYLIHTKLKSAVFIEGATRYNKQINIFVTASKNEFWK